MCSHPWARDRNNSCVTSEGVEVVKNSMAAQRAEILVKFMGAKVGTKDWKRKYMELAEKVMFEDKAVSSEDTDTVEVDSPIEATPLSGSGLSSPLVALQSQAEEVAAFEREILNWPSSCLWLNSGDMNVGCQFS
jgi:hypothetical protein